MKIWSLFEHETMTTGNKIMWKRGEIAPKEQFLLISTLLYIYIFLTLGVKLHSHLLNMVVQFIVFLTLSTLICRGTDISKCFSESLGIRDNESRLYMYLVTDSISEYCGFISTPRIYWDPSLNFDMSRDTAFPTRLHVHVRPAKIQISLHADQSFRWASEIALDPWLSAECPSQNLVRMCECADTQI